MATEPARQPGDDPDPSPRHGDHGEHDGPSTDVRDAADVGDALAGASDAEIPADQASTDPATISAELAEITTSQLQGGGDKDLPPMLLRCGEDVPPPLMLVLPARLGATQTLRDLAQAIQAVRNDFGEQARRWKANCDRAQAEGDQLRQAMWHGTVMTWVGACHTIDQAIYEKFGLLGQAQASDPPSAWGAEAMAEQAGVDIDRPEFPLPDVDGVLAASVAAMRTQAQEMVALAVLERSVAQEWVEDCECADVDLDHCPYYHEHYNRAITWAMAADRIGAALADAFGLTAEYQTFLEMHGPWLGRIA